MGCLDTVDLNELRGKVESALVNLYKQDSDLLNRDVDEKSISHRLASYLQSEFTDLKVDCEYNKHGDKGKKLGDAEEMLELLRQRYTPEQLMKKIDGNNAIVVRPDIVVHTRGIDDNNEIVIEMKKIRNKDIWKKRFDEEKLKAFTNKSNENPYTAYHYNYGLFLDIPTGKAVNSLDQWMTDCLKEWQWFENGKSFNV